VDLGGRQGQLALVTEFGTESPSGIKQREEKILEARGGVEPPMMVLQTIALPLGYRARAKKLSVFNHQWSAREKTFKGPPN
jgi:hypothetical protein